MGDINDKTRIVVVQDDAEGQPRFIDAPKAVPIDIPGVVHGGYFWGTERTPSLPDYIGAVPEEFTFPPVGGTRLGLFEWAAHSDGKFDAGVALDEAEAGEGGDAEMHATNTVDYEVILSGKVDIEFPGGVVTTLEAGDVLVMGGSAHAWKNRYDEPCRYVAFLVGAERR
jgi:uncharacterized cupin superfamily protein